MDLFDKEQKIFDDATACLEEIKLGAAYDFHKHEKIVKEYGKLLKQLRRVTKLSDKTTVNLNINKMDLQDKVYYDVLTGIYNRRFMEERLEHIKSSLGRSHNSMLSVLMMDIDFFKKYNDYYGHDAGDECIKAVAKAIASCVTRADDFVARYGGEEFIAVLPNTDKNGACEVAEKISESIKALNMPHDNSEVASYVTVSTGITTGIVTLKHNGSDFIKRADKALYKSKNLGRNRYTHFEFEGEKI